MPESWRFSVEPPKNTLPARKLKIQCWTSWKHITCLKIHYLHLFSHPQWMHTSALCFWNALLLNISKCILLGFNVGTDSSKRHEDRLRGQGSTYQSPNGRYPQIEVINNANSKLQSGSTFSIKGWLFMPTD
jgi:hypothetical protein